jgi:uncharacterized OsmC-like protein
MVETRVTYEGELRCEATHGPSGRKLETDAPVDNHGKGESFSPTDLVGTALGSCALTIMGIAAERHGWDIRGATAEVLKHMTEVPRRRIERVEIAIAVPAELDERARKILQKAALGCPVNASLHPDVEVAVSFRWGPA